MALYFQANEKERSNKRILRHRKKGILGVIFASLLISSAREYLSKIGLCQFFYPLPWVVVPYIRQKLVASSWEKSLNTDRQINGLNEFRRTFESVVQKKKFMNINQLNTKLKKRMKKRKEERKIEDFSWKLEIQVTYLLI